MTHNADTFTVLRAPEDVGRFRPERVPAPQRIDYAQHPAYAEFVRNQPFGTRATATARFLRSLAPLAAKRLINYELIPNGVRMQRKDMKGKLRFAAAGIRNMLFRSRRRSDITTPVAQTLHVDGCLVVAAPPQALRPVEAASAAAFGKLEMARAARAAGVREFEESRLHADRREDEALFATVDTFLREAGVLNAASEYLGRAARLIDVNPQINDPSDSFWRDIFPDLGGEALPKAAYFHRDASGGDLKTIIYMSDVGAQNGPFAYALGSHRVPMKRLHDFICEANDHNGLAHTDQRSRRHFAALPALFRQKGAFGNDLPDEHPASDEILMSAWSITGPKGAAVLFDTKGIHRGGMVEQGERRVITCVLG